MNTTIERVEEIPPICWARGLYGDFEYSEEEDAYTLKRQKTQRFKEIIESRAERKPEPKFLQFVHDTQYCQPNIGRILTEFKRIYLKRQEVWRFRRESFNLSPFYVKTIREFRKNLQFNPYEKFIPSQHLVNLVQEHMIHPYEDEVLKLLEDIEKAAIKTKDTCCHIDKSHNIANLITEQVEGLITNLAKRSYKAKNPIKISNGNRFTPEICGELTKRLGLDPYDLRPVLDCLYNELFNFISIGTRERVWGKVNITNSEIKLILTDNAFSLPNFDEIEKDEKWTIT
ncbi:MAG: hypothetical protein AB1611_01910 [bacterium]